MWIQELFIDAFDGLDNLGLPGLSPSINVIRMPSDAEAKQLVRFVPGILFGETIGRARPRGGSMLVRSAVEPDEWGPCDLSRVWLPDHEALSDLQVGPDAAQEPLLDTIRAIDPQRYSAIFTDVLPPIERVAIWRQAADLDGLFADSSPPETVAPRGPTPRPPHDTLTAALANWNEFRQQTPPAPGPTPPPGDPVTEASRKDYLTAKSQARELRQRLHTLRAERDQVEREAAALEVATELSPTWQEWQSIKKQFDPITPATCTEQDVAAVKRLDAELKQLREQLQTSKQAQPTTDAAEPTHEAGDALASEMEAILVAWPDCDEHRQRRDELTLQLTDLEQPADDASSGYSSADAERDIQRIQQAARHRTTPPPDPAVEATENDNTDADTRGTPRDERIERLQRQVRQLRDETRFLLARQLLSRRALMWIGLMFAVGVAILLSAIVLNLGGAQMSVGAIGLTCILASALLKISFERAPSYELQRQRMRITELMNEIARLQDRSGDTSAEESRNAEDEPRFEPFVAPPHDDPDRRQWRQTLAALDLPSHFGQEQAIDAIRQRVVQQDAHSTKRRQKLTREIQQHEARITQWCQRVADCLPATSDRPPVHHEHAHAWHAQLSHAMQLRREQAQRHRESRRSKAPAKRAAAIQKEIKLKKRQRRELLQQANAANLADMQKQLAGSAQRQQWQQKLQTLRQQVDARLSDVEDAESVRHALKSADLPQRCEQTRARLGELKTELRRAQRELQAAQKQVEQLASQRHPATQDNPPCQALAWHALTGAIFKSLPPRLTSAPEVPDSEPVSDRTSAWRQTASQRLSDLSGRDNQQVRWDHRAAPLMWVDGQTGEATELDQLATDEQHLLVLAIQLGLVAHVSEILGPLPMILRDASLRHAPSTCRAIIQQLCRVADADQQILFVTTHAAVTEWFHEHDIPSLVVQRQLTDVSPTDDEPPERPAPAHPPLEATPVPVQTLATAVDLSLAGPTTVEYERFDPLDHSDDPTLDEDRLAANSLRRAYSD